MDAETILALYLGVLGFFFGYYSRRQAPPKSPDVYVNIDRRFVDLWLEQKGMVAVPKGALKECDKC